MGKMQYVFNEVKHLFCAVFVLFIAIFSGNAFGAVCASGEYDDVGVCKTCDMGYYCVEDIKYQCESGKITAVSGASDVSQCENPEFSVTTTSLAAGTAFSFKMSAKGNFVVDWGDGSTPQTITRTDTTETTYSHTYTTAGIYTIGISGQATGYNSSKTTAAISFIEGMQNSVLGICYQPIAGISGSLGAVFGTCGTEQPSFYFTFSNCKTLTGSIPENLFNGIFGEPRTNMFFGTFQHTNLTGRIPENLFVGISGKPTPNLFNRTFQYCSGLTGSIPENLFANISGVPVSDAFSFMFYGCSGLTGSIPENLFAGIKGNLVGHTFYMTFSLCSGLTGFVPPKLFSGITNTNYSSGPMKDVFSGTGLVTSCPTGYKQYITGFESDFSGKVSCVEPTLTILWNADNGSESFTTQCAVDGDIVLPTPPEKRGYTFTGWKLITATE